MKTKKPRKQRKSVFNAPMHKKRRGMAAHLEEKLLLKYDRRSIPVVKGDAVKVMRGSFKGHEDKVSRVNVRKRSVEVEGLTMIKADGKKIAKPIHPSNLLVTKLNLTDKWRRKKLERGLPEEAKKEIEKEAEEQLQELEEEKKKLEEAAKKEEKLEEAEEIGEEEIPEKVPTEKKKEESKKKEEKKPPQKKPKKTPSKPEKKEEPTVKKKGSVSKKRTVKKPAAKPTAKKKEAKK